METTEVLTCLSLACTFDERLSSLHLLSSKGDQERRWNLCGFISLHWNPMEPLPYRNPGLPPKCFIWRWAPRAKWSRGHPLPPEQLAQNTEKTPCPELSFFNDLWQCTNLSTNTRSLSLWQRGFHQGRAPRGLWSCVLSRAEFDLWNET